MTAIILDNLQLEEIPIGTLVICDNGLARPYAEGKDNIEDVIGVSYPRTRTSGRGYSNADGEVFYTKDYFEWSSSLQLVSNPEDFEYGDDPMLNPDFEPTNPLNELTKYTLCLYNGLGAVSAAYSALPSRWRIIREFEDYRWVLIR